jgi:hypothetical protein
VKYRLSFFFVRAWLGLLLLAVLNGCTIFHPYRLPTPKPSPEYKAQQEAAAKARKDREKSPGSFFSKKKIETADVEAATDVSTPTAGAVATTATTAEARTLPEGPTVKYDKHQMMKKPKLMRRRRRNKGGKPFRPIESIRNFFKYGLHAKPNYSPDHRPAPKPAASDAAPDAPEPRPANAAPAPTGKP